MYPNLNRSQNPNPRRNVFWLIALSWVITACSTTPDRPQWIDVPSSAFPDATHLTAVGSADDQQTAGDRAIANLSKIFEVAIQESSQDSSSTQMVSMGAESHVENQQSITREINVETRKALQGAKVMEYWQSETGRHYALAVLAKQPAISGFTQAILKADKEVESLLAYASKEANNPLVALAALQKAADIQRKRDENNLSLMVVKNGQGVKSKTSAGAIDELQRNALAALQVQVDAENRSVQSELQQALSSLGIKTVEQSNLVLHGTMDVAPVSHQQGWFWQRGSYELTFNDGDTVLAKKRYPLKVSAREEAMVEQRLKDELNKNLPQYVFELMSVSAN